MKNKTRQFKEIDFTSPPIIPLSTILSNSRELCEVMENRDREILFLALGYFARGQIEAEGKREGEGGRERNARGKEG